MLISKFINKKQIFLCIAVLLLLGLFSFRVIHLDQDLPPWGVAYYQPIDEGAYSNMAINYRIFGAFAPTPEQTGGPDTLLTGNFMTSILGNLLTIAGFRIFGNNYYGLRMGYVLLSLANLIVFYFTLNSIRKKYSRESHSAIMVLFAFLLWMVLDFSFLVNARVAEPSSSRLLFVQLIMIVYFEGSDLDHRKYAIIGFLTTISVFLIYITNVFLYLACGLTLLLSWGKFGWKIFWKQAVMFALGTATAFILAEIYYIALFDTEAITNTLNTVFSFGNNSSSASAFTVASPVPGLRGVLLTIKNICVYYFTSNSFTYNLPVMAGFLIMIPMALYLVWKDKNTDVFFLHAVSLCLLLQTFISPDCITRKQIIVFPTIMGLMYLYVLRAKDIYAIFTTLPTMQIGKFVVPKLASCSIRIVVGTFWISLSLFAFLYAANYRLNVFEETALDYDSMDRIIIVCLGIVPVFAGLACVLISSLIRIVRKHFMQEECAIINSGLFGGVVAFLFIAMLLCNTVFSLKYVWLNESYVERNIMVKMSETVDDRYVFGGGFQLGYCLYNDMLPIVSTSENTVSQLREFENALVLDYRFVDGTDLKARMRMLYPDSGGLRFYTVDSYPRTFQTFGICKWISLYGFTILK